MKSLQYTFWGLLLAVSVFFLWASSLPSELFVSVKKSYSFSEDFIFNEISDFGNWHTWFPWMDEDMRIEVSGDPAKPGHQLSWSHPEQGNGFFKITEISKNSISMDLQFDEDSDIVYTHIKLIAKKTGDTELIWTISDEKHYNFPLGRIHAFAMKKMSSRSMEQGLIDFGISLNY